MPEGYEGVTQRDSRLGDQDQARRRGGAVEGLGASREGGRGRGQDREGLGPVQRRRRPGGGGPGRPGGGPSGGRSRPGGGRPRGRGQDATERPRDEAAAAETTEQQTPVTPDVPTTPEPAADAPEPTTPQAQAEESTGTDEKTGGES
jgi:hypothetical protein